MPLTGDEPLMLGAPSMAMAAGWLAVGLAALVACGGAAAFVRARRSTLAAPAMWCVAAAAAVGGAEAWLLWRDATIEPLTASLVRYAAAAGVVCPMMAVLGAKRPQDRGWQWVVAALWCILLVPAAQALAARSGERLELFGAWRLLLAALVAMVLLNYLPTRFALAACLAAAGQVGLLAPQLLGVDDATSWRVAGLALLLAAVAAAFFMRRRGEPATVGEPDKLGDATLRWLDFRDGWGAFWALRVMQRVNQSAELGNWPVRLEWSGFTPADCDAAAGEQIDAALDALLWRFERVESSAPRFSLGPRSM